MYMEKGFINAAPAPGLALQDQYTYLLVVHPPPAVEAQVMEEKQHFTNLYRDQGALKSPPHITVGSFLAKEEMEDTLVRYLHRIAGTLKRFGVALNNFSGFPPHTVYARVQDQQPFKQLAAALEPVERYISSNGCPPVKFSTHPHMAIARRLNPGTYEQAMFTFSQRSFYAAFTVQELVLLKRRTSFDAARQVSVFRLL